MSSYLYSTRYDKAEDEDGKVDEGEVEFAENQLIKDWKLWGDEHGYSTTSTSAGATYS